MRATPESRSRALDYVVYLISRFFIATLGSLPCSLLYPLMGFLGRVFYLVHPRLRRTTYSNLEHAFGASRSPRELRRMTRASFVHFLKTIADVIKSGRLLRPETVDRYVEFAGFEMLEPLKGKGTGILFVTGHMGSFEIAGSSWGAKGVPLQTVSRPIDNPFLERYVWAKRSVMGQGRIGRKGAVRESIQALKRGDNVAFLVDQNQRKRPVFVPFFGRLAATTKTPAVIALRLGIPVVLGGAVRIGKGFKFRAECYGVIEPPSEGTQEERIHRLTCEIQSELQRIIEREPEQYLWLHDRWKTRPEDVTLREEHAGSVVQTASS